MIPTVFEIIESYKYKGYEMELDKLSLFVHSVINENIELNNDYEIIWALSFANKLMISIDKETTEKLCKYENSLVNILVMILNDKNLIHSSADFSNYKSFITSNDLYDENWIFLYECCINNWLDKDSSILRNDNFFQQLLEHHISFISPNYSAVKIEVKNILSNLCIKKYSKSSDRDLGALLEDIISEYQINLEEDFKDSIFESLHSQIEEVEPEAEPEVELEIETEVDPDVVSEKETEIGNIMELNNWSKLFLLSKMKNKQIRISVEEEY